MREDKRNVEVETDRRRVKVAYTSEIDMESEGTCDESDIRGRTRCSKGKDTCRTEIDVEASERQEWKEGLGRQSREVCEKFWVERKKI